MPKSIIAIMQAGGMDGMNAVNYRDTSSVGFMTTARSGAPSNLRNYGFAPYRDAVVVTKDANTITVSDVTGLAAGNLVYGVGFARSRRLTLSSILDNGNGTFTLTISGKAYKSGTGRVYFATATHLFDANETPALTLGATEVLPAFNQNLRWFSDAFNVKDIPENANETKLAVISNIAPMIVPYLKLNNASGIYNLRTYASDGVTLRPIVANEDVKNKTSHNDQQSTWVANAPEGAIRGWGGGIADTFIDAVPSDLMKQLTSISLETGNAYTAGTVAATYALSNRAILLQYPGYSTTAWPTGKENATTNSELTEIIRQAAKMDPADYQNDFHQATSALNRKSEDFQKILKVVPAITSIPAGTSSLAQGFLGNLRQILRLMLMNNPNRGYTLTRSGTTVTAETQVSTGTATRTAGSTTCTCVVPGHGLFTSNTEAIEDITDWVIITGLDATPPAKGYRVTLVQGDEDTKFTVTSTANTALTDAPITVRLKHNNAVGNNVFVKQSTASIDASEPAEGYAVTSTPNDYTLTFDTAQAGALPANTTAFVKLVHLDKQVFFTNTPGFSWDTHNSENSTELGYFDEGLAYLDSIGKRMVNSDYIGFTMTDFGRTYTTNATGGTDHGWGGYAFVWGKKVKGNRIYGDAIDYNPSGAHIGSNMLIPTTAVYQYGATIAKWMGATDAQVIGLFPKIVNWPANKRYLDFV